MQRSSRAAAVLLVILGYGILGLAALGAAAGRAGAQDYPARSVTIVAPSAPGGM